jgi:hypothetical protein
MRRVIRAVAQTTAAVARAAMATVRGVADVAYSPTVKGKVAQGATELSNTLYTGHAYSPYTAENAAHRAQFQRRDQSRGMER